MRGKDMEPKKEIELLSKELEYHNRQYYVLDDPKISDFDYDHMLRRLEELEKEYPQYASPTSPTRRVGGEAISQFQKVQHAVPLESLQDVFSFDELREFDARVRTEEPGAEYSVEPKVDGLSVALEYVDGVFTRGATRGDGLIGEDVTENLKTIRSIPMHLEGAPARMIVRGSIYMSLKDVVPVAIISIIASALPAAMSSAVIRSSTGIIFSNSQRSSGRSLPTPRSSVIAAWQWQLIRPGISSLPDMSRVSSNDSAGRSLPM